MCVCVCVGVVVCVCVCVCVCWLVGPWTARSGDDARKCYSTSGLCSQWHRVFCAESLCSVGAACGLDGPAVPPQLGRIASYSGQKVPKPNESVTLLI